VTAPPAEQEIRVTTGESKGDPSILNPEQLLLMSASSCQMLWFLHLAAKARIDVVAYDDDAEALMPERVRSLVETAHGYCFIANSLSCAMTIEPTVERR
jgi:organic hydroperoxide reductase OsmC/OhrA